MCLCCVGHRSCVPRPSLDNRSLEPSRAPVAVGDGSLTKSWRIPASKPARHPLLAAMGLWPRCVLSAPAPRWALLQVSTRSSFVRVLAGEFPGTGCLGVEKVGCLGLVAGRLGFSVEASRGACSKKKQKTTKGSRKQVDKRFKGHAGCVAGGPLESIPDVRGPGHLVASWLTEEPCVFAV